jgi:citrate synthase
MSAPEIYSPGLEGVVAGETAISTVTGGLRYRGYPVTELAELTSFDEVAYLLLYGELPNAGQLTAFQQRVAAARHLPPSLLTLLQSLPKETLPMDVLRSAVSVLAHFDLDAQESSVEANLRKAERLLGQIPVAVADFSARASRWCRRGRTCRTPPTCCTCCTAANRALPRRGLSTFP